MVLIEQIVATIVINLEVADVDRILVRRSLLDPVENISKRTRYDASVCIPLGAARNREGLARAGLTVCEYCPVVAFEGAVDDVLGNLVEDALLLRQHV